MAGARLLDYFLEKKDTMSAYQQSKANKAYFYINV